MADEQHPVCCPQCGSLVQAGDRFCGVCGAGVPPDAQEVTPTQEIPTQVPPPPSIPSRRRNRKLINGVMVGVLLFLLLIGAGAMALTNLGSGAGLLGGAEKDTAPSGTSDASKDSSESSESPGVKPDAPPDPAFEHLLPTLEGMTDASIMLPARLPDEMDLPAINGYYSGEEYGIVFPYGPTETVPEVSNAETLGTGRNTSKLSHATDTA